MDLKKYSLNELDALTRQIEEERTKRLEEKEDTPDFRDFKDLLRSLSRPFVEDMNGQRFTITVEFGGKFSRLVNFDFQDGKLHPVIEEYDEDLLASPEVSGNVEDGLLNEVKYYIEDDIYSILTSAGFLSKDDKLIAGIYQTFQEEGYPISLEDLSYRFEMPMDELKMKICEILEEIEEERP